MLFSNFSISSRNTWLMRLICFFWIVGKIMCCKLWLADRLFPLVPVFNLYVPSVVHLVLFILSLTALLLWFIFPANQAIRISVLVIEILSCLLDQIRWQPWEVQYFFLLLIFVINWKKEKNIVSVIGFVMAAMYFHSGLSKLNPVFVHSVWCDTILVDLLHFNSSLAHQTLVYHSGYLLGIIELVLSLGLFFKRTIKISCIFLIVMHLLIILMFGPLGINYDMIIWPWNLELIILLTILILYNPAYTISFQSLKSGANKFIVILFGVLPIFNLFGYWEYFFSFSLFSCRPPDMYICFKKADYNKDLQAYAMHKKVMACDSNSCMIYVREWAFAEMLVPENPEIRVYKVIKEQLLKKYPGMEATFITYTYHDGKKVRAELP